MENKHSPYATMLLLPRIDNMNDEKKIKKLITVLHSRQVELKVQRNV